MNVHMEELFQLSIFDKSQGSYVDIPPGFPQGRTITIDECKCNIHQPTIPLINLYDQYIALVKRGFGPCFFFFGHDFFIVRHD